jgi:hypothetical protein
MIGPAEVDGPRIVGERAGARSPHGLLGPTLSLGQRETERKPE